MDISAIMLLITVFYFYMNDLYHRYLTIAFVSCSKKIHNDQVNKNSRDRLCKM